MKTPLLKSNSASSEGCKPESILADWIRAMTDFHSYYHQLVTCINHREIEQDLTLRNTGYIGQCPVNLLIELVSAMEEGLKKLSQDIDQPDQFRQSAIAQNYEKLLIHTRVLNRLNQQAQNRLYLITLPSS